MKALWRKGGASFWAAGCGVIRSQGLAPHGLRVLEAARALQGGVPNASGWVGPLDALQALDTTPGPVSLGCLNGIATVVLRYCYGSAPMLMPSTWEHYRGDTVEIPCLHRACWLGGMLGAARGFSILRKALATAPPSQVIGVTSSFSPRSAWRSRRGPASNACLSRAGLEKVVLTPPSLKSRRGSVQRKR
jgi:hypothetical protein